MNRTYAQTAVVHPVRGGTPLAARFILTAGVILAVTGAAKLWSALGTSKFLPAVDPILGLKFGQLLLAVGLAEIAVALVCCLSKRQTLALGLVAWLATELSGLSRRPVVDGLEATMWVSGESHGRPPPLAAGGGEHHESPAGVPGLGQLRTVDLAMAATTKQSGR